MYREETDQRKCVAAEKRNADGEPFRKQHNKERHVGHYEASEPTETVVNVVQCA